MGSLFSTPHTPTTYGWTIPTKYISINNSGEALSKSRDKVVAEGTIEEISKFYLVYRSMMLFRGILISAIKLKRIEVLTWLSQPHEVFILMDKLAPGSLFDTNNLENIAIEARSALKNLPNNQETIINV
ncbi:Hypothetical protein ORPV_284 [Orpheovirus IHUMI-LCC2]|uniref:Uncharacterized protein n=1 Tax=Orpheovirus IHUMI-LCC2 TaxID=2023057 RepID=A0A2I2L3T1_9VIRU|nr:Hypothetical protein ORPV_284 [Orpheovirus IHUMI-LCC2]SNW62188.1 Hypothetical protein ORPV_284 [Orpheovirus IHUMI-LCC2]